jgi:uncharacterized protein YdhG (YjbR/CyaY superfamily)
LARVHTRAILASMKKGASSRKTPVKRPRTETVEDYLDGVTEPARSTLEKVRTTIRSLLPKDAEEVISYQIPAFKYKKVLIWYAAFSDHCSLFPTAAVIDEFRKELRPYRISKGTVQFPIDRPFPAPLLKKMVKARLAQVQSK